MIRLVYDKVGTVNGNTCEGINTSDSLKGTLWLNNHPFVEVDTASTDSTSIYLYPILPLHFDRTFGDGSKNVINHISNLALSKLQDPTSTFNLLLYFPYEGYNLRVFNYLTIKFLANLTTEHSIPPSKIFVCYGDANIKDNLFNTPVKCGIPKENVLGVHIFEQIAYGDFQKTTIEIPNRTPISREKRFLYKNGVPRSHRMYIAGALHAKGLLEHTHFSWLNSTKFDYVNFTNVVEGTFSLYNNDNFNSVYHDSFLDLIKKEPITLDITQDQAELRENQITNSRYLYDTSYASFVTETVADEFNAGVKFISEKLYQPIYNFHPFIVAGGSGILETLHKDGYETFPELFDESYDKIRNCSNRINTVIEQVQNFCNTDTGKLNDIYYSDTFQDKLVHNWKNFINSGGRREINKLYHWLLQVSNNQNLI